MKTFMKEQIYFLGTSSIVVGETKVRDHKITRIIKVSQSIYLHLLKRFFFFPTVKTLEVLHVIFLRKAIYLDPVLSTH